MIQAPYYDQDQNLAAIETAFRLPRYPDPMISITVNGETRQFEQPLDCAELLARLELAGKRVALERNGEIVPRSRHAAERLADGDRLEIVVAVGGG